MGSVWEGLANVWEVPGKSRWKMFWEWLGGAELSANT